MNKYRTCVRPFVYFEILLSAETFSTVGADVRSLFGVRTNVYKHFVPGKE